MVEAEACVIPNSFQIVLLVQKCHKEPATLSKKYGLILSMCAHTKLQQEFWYFNRLIEERKTQRIHSAGNLEI